MAVFGDLHDPSAQRSEFAERIIAGVNQNAALYGTALWVSAIVCLVVFARGDFPAAPVEFTMLECWLIGLGCVGVPILVMRFLGNRLTPVTCLVVAALLTGIAGTFTGLVATGQLHVSVLVSVFSLIIPEALAIHAVNAADCLHRIDAAVAGAVAGAHAERDRAVEAAFLSGIAASYTHSRDRAAEIQQLTSGSTEEIQAVTGALLAELDKRHARAHEVQASGGRILHMVSERRMPPQDNASGN